jgi:hypothetical protein
MANLILNGSTSGSITISSPAVSGTNTLTLPANTGTVITTGSTFAGTGPAFSAYAGASQTVSSNTATKIAIDTENFDTASCFDTTDYRFTPNVEGYYQVNGILRARFTTTFTQLAVDIYKNGSQYERNQLVTTFTASTNCSMNISSLIYLNGTTDYIELYGTIVGTGTGTFTNTSASATSLFSASLVRGA